MIKTFNGFKIQKWGGLSVGFIYIYIMLEVGYFQNVNQLLPSDSDVT